MKVAIIGRSFNKECIPYIKEMFANLYARKTEVYVVSSFYSYLEKEISLSKTQITAVFTKDDIPQVDYFFSVGGDGTFLDTVTYVGERETPILGINVGRMGFLATIPRTEINEALENLEAKQFDIDSRAMLQIEMENNSFLPINYALNDISISKRDTSSMITIHTKIDGEFLNSYWADGLIISTATGSTGYSLSCGGPIMMPSSSNFIIAPINPHNLTARPLIISDKSSIELSIETRSQSYLATLDSRSIRMSQKQKITIKKAPFKANMIRNSAASYLQALKSKLNWGYDVRN
ncbi:MAG: NAD kinase [Cyclobacteriaceae bacterium]